MDSYHFRVLLDRIAGLACTVCATRPSRLYPDGPRCSAHPPTIPWPGLGLPPGERYSLPAQRHPAPEVEQRPADPEQIPATASRLVALAEAAGWWTGTTYARGTLPGKAPRVVDSIVVRFRREIQRAVASWTDGRYDTGWRWTVGLSRPAAVGYRALGTLVSTPPTLTAEEFAELLRQTDTTERAASDALRQYFRVETIDPSPGIKVINS